jgi:thiamine-phosphate pyrophosphorylase
MGLTRRLSGLYFVVDPTTPSRKLLDLLEGALEGGVDVVQVWSAWKDREPYVEVVRRMKSLAGRHGVPLLVNNDLTMGRLAGADGMHMDRYELTPAEIREKLGGRGIVGYTVGNDISRVKWAESVGADYISFCSIFPSGSVTDCEIVPLQTVRRARGLTDISIFASGGITPANAAKVLEEGADGVAVISAIQNAEDPREAARQLKMIISSVPHHRT